MDQNFKIEIEFRYRVKHEYENNCDKKQTHEYEIVRRFKTRVYGII